jgi:hypothetical protein
MAAAIIRMHIAGVLLQKTRWMALYGGRSHKIGCAACPFIYEKAMRVAENISYAGALCVRMYYPRGAHGVADVRMGHS